MDDRALNLRLHAACSIAAEAGALARHLLLNRPQGDYALKGPQDYLTEADGAVEALVRERLATVFPDDGMIGEETEGAFGGGDLDRRSDGRHGQFRARRTAFLRLDRASGGRPAELGAIAAPMQSELYAAQHNRGATLNGRPIRAAATRSLSEAVVELGWSPRRPAADYLDRDQNGCWLRAPASAGPESRTLGLAYVGRPGAPMAMPN